MLNPNLGIFTTLQLVLVSDLFNWPAKWGVGWCMMLTLSHWTLQECLHDKVFQVNFWYGTLAFNFPAHTSSSWVGSSWNVPWSFKETDSTRCIIISRCREREWSKSCSSSAKVGALKGPNCAPRLLEPSWNGADPRNRALSLFVTSKASCLLDRSQDTTMFQCQARQS